MAGRMRRLRSRCRGVGDARSGDYLRRARGQCTLSLHLWRIDRRSDRGVVPQSRRAYPASVSDRIGGSDRFYCDPSPRLRWTRTTRSYFLTSALERYLTQYVSVPGGLVGTPRGLEATVQNPLGRWPLSRYGPTVDAFSFEANDVRLSCACPMARFSTAVFFRPHRAGRFRRVARATFEGGGYGHGIGVSVGGNRASAGRSRFPQQS